MYQWGNFTMLLRGCLVLWMWLSPCSLSHQNLLGSPPFLYPWLSCVSLCFPQAFSGSWQWGFKPSSSSWRMSPYSANKGPNSPVHQGDGHLMKSLTSGSTDLRWLSSSCPHSPPCLPLASPFPTFSEGESLCAACQCGRGFPRQGIVRQEVVREEERDFHLWNRETWWQCYRDSRVVPWLLGWNTVGRGPTHQAPSAASRANELPGQTNGVLIGD